MRFPTFNDLHGGDLSQHKDGVVLTHINSFCAAKSPDDDCSTYCSITHTTCTKPVSNNINNNNNSNNITTMEPLIKGPSKRGTTSLQRTLPRSPNVYCNTLSNFWKQDSLPQGTKWWVPKYPLLGGSTVIAIIVIF